jgi:chromatin modification-related protein VID21
VQDVAAEEAPEADVALPEIDEPPAEAKSMDIEEDLFSVHDESTPFPTTEPAPEPAPEPTPEPEPESAVAVASPGPTPAAISLDNSEHLEVDASPDVTMHDGLPVPAEEPETQLEIDVDPPPEIVRPETPLSEAESMVIDEDDNEGVIQAEQPEPHVVERAESPPRVLDTFKYDDAKEATPQPTVILAAPPGPVLIRQPVSALSPPPVFNFSGVPSPVQSPSEPPATPPRHGYHPTYTLPPLKALPADFSRKTKPAKLQRKHKEREKSGGDKAKDKDDWTPLGVSRWGATIRANPVHVKVQRAPKCLNSREWGVSVPSIHYAAISRHLID